MHAEQLTEPMKGGRQSSVRLVAIHIGPETFRKDLLGYSGSPFGYHGFQKQQTPTGGFGLKPDGLAIGPDLESPE